MKNTGKMAKAQGKHKEFGINWSVATLLYPGKQNSRKLVHKFKVMTWLEYQENCKVLED